MAAHPDGYAELIAWAHSLGEVHAFGVEGCGSYGSGLARFLRRHDHPIHEVARPPRKGERRRSGKSDAIDAEHTARTVLSGVGTATLKLANGQIEAIRVIKIARDSAVKARATTMVSLKAVLVTACDELRIELEPLSKHKLVVVCAALEAKGDRSDPHVAIRHTLSHLAQRWLNLHEEMPTSNAARLRDAQRKRSSGASNATSSARYTNSCPNLPRDLDLQNSPPTRLDNT